MNWLRQHGIAFADALRHLLRAPGSFALNAAVAALTLALPFMGFTLLQNLRPVSEQLAVEPEVSIYLAMGTPREQANALAPKIRRITQEAGAAARLEFVPRENALGLLKERTGLSDAITALGENPLPDSYVLKLAQFRDAVDASRVDTLAAQLKALPGVEYVQVDSAWVKRLAGLMHLLRLGLLFLAVTLGVVVVAVVFNTIRLQVMSQRKEIEICRMFGATDGFICRPFYYTGVLLGLCAGALALVTVVVFLHPLNAAIAEFARLYASEFRLAPPAPASLLALLGGSAGLGLAGAWLSVRRQLGRLG